MAIIDPKGLFLGDRLSWCSDEAQLHWPRLYAAANNYARVELNYRKLVAAAYSSFQKPPTEEQFWEWIREYKTNFLLLVYQVEGVGWGQWATNERYLLGYKNAEDKRSPAPPGELQDQFRKQYLAHKSTKSKSNERFADLFGVVHGYSELPEVAGTGGDLSGLPSVGVGVGVGVGEKNIVEETEPQCTPEPQCNLPLNGESPKPQKPQSSPAAAARDDVGDLAVTGNALDKAVEAGWKYFIKKAGKRSTQYKFRKDRQAIGRAGFKELIDFSKVEWEDEDPMTVAGELFQVAVDRLVSAPFHCGQNKDGKQYFDWHLLFKGNGFSPPGRLLEDWLDDSRGHKR